MPTITLSELAKSKLDEYLSEEPSDTIVRILLEDNGKYGLSLDQRGEGDADIDGGEGIQVVIEKALTKAVDGLRIDYLEQGASSGFSLTGGNPDAGAIPGVLRVEETPNPDAKKFVLTVSVGKRPRTWTQNDRESFTPVITRLFELGAASVFQLDRFVTVTRTEGKDWAELEPKIREVLADIQPSEQAAAAAKRAPGGDGIYGQLEEFIARDVAPFLQKDGGDIELVAFEEGVVKVKLLGACGTCPSSIATLHMGVEKRLKEAFEEVSSLERIG